jgi:hypothetical protein
MAMTPSRESSLISLAPRILQRPEGRNLYSAPRGKQRPRRVPALDAGRSGRSRELVFSPGAPWRAVKPTAGTRPSWRREPSLSLPHQDLARQAEPLCLASDSAHPKVNSARADQRAV